MKMKFNKYWMLMSAIIIMNIFIFVIFSNRLESYVERSVAINLTID